MDPMRFATQAQQFSGSTSSVGRLRQPPSKGTDILDAAVLVRISAGELDALAELYDRYKAIAYSIACRITKDPSLAEDVVQEAFLGAWRNAARYVEGRGSVKTWLLAIVHHRAIDVVRRRRMTCDLPEWESSWPTALTRPDIWRDVASSLDVDAVQAALAVLTVVQRTALELAYFGGLTQTQIAAQTHTPLGTVKSRIRLGLLAMRHHLEIERLVWLAPTATEEAPTPRPSVTYRLSAQARRENVKGR